MVRSFVHHHVRDYDAWRQVYDGFGEAQREHGVRAEAVFRSLDNPNNVIVTHDFDDAESARAFFDLPELRDAMQRAGVEDEPTVWFAEEVD